MEIAPSFWYLSALAVAIYLMPPKFSPSQLSTQPFSTSEKLKLTACSILTIIAILIFDSRARLFLEDVSAYYFPNLTPTIATANVLAGSMVTTSDCSYRSHSLRKNARLTISIARTGRLKEAFELLREEMELEFNQRQIHSEDLHEILCVFINIDRDGKICTKDWVQLCSPSNELLEHQWTDCLNAPTSEHFRGISSVEGLAYSARIYATAFNLHKAYAQELYWREALVSFHANRLKQPVNYYYESALYSLALCYHNNGMEEQAKRPLHELKSILQARVVKLGRNETVTENSLLKCDELLAAIEKANDKSEDT